jgi:archaemetzincin
VAAGIHIFNASFLQLRNFDGTVQLLETITGRSVTVAQAVFDIQQAFDTSRQQYNSTALLAQLLERYLTPNDKGIAIVDVDLYIPILTFVFGEAQLTGYAAVVSTHRLSNQFYGLQRDDALMMHRLEKEIVHEICHTFGLYHCREFECVMRSSTYVEEIDWKQAYPCEACTFQLKENCKKMETISTHRFSAPGFQ